MNIAAPNVDLHCHSTVSDGSMPPAAVARRAHANGVDVWALTDHDHIVGLRVDPANEALVQGLRDTRAGRAARA
ncbi:PHP domain-containing protein, partial [Bordetella pertussis]|uniref:PHP domain-containing protein n=1 Tax=Bordetella pertussis TaxID=520 RepID=UPI001C9E3FFB